MYKGIKLIVWCIVTDFTALMLLVGLFSCNSVKQATKHYNKAKTANVITVAQLARSDFPCINVKRDTVRGKDSIIIKERIVPQLVQVDCPDTARDAKPGSTMKTNVNAPCKCKDSIQVEWGYITDYVEDSTKTFEAYKQRDHADQSAAKSENNMKIWRGIAIAIGTLLIITIILLILKIKL